MTTLKHATIAEIVELYDLLNGVTKYKAVTRNETITTYYTGMLSKSQPHNSLNWITGSMVQVIPLTN